MTDNIRQNARNAYPISDSVRNAMLTIWNGDAKIETYGSAMHYLECHFPNNKIEFALAWLIRNNLKGKRFDEFLANECHGSNLELHRILLTKVEKISGDVRRIIAGRDFK